MKNAIAFLSLLLLHFISYGQTSFNSELEKAKAGDVNAQIRVSNAYIHGIIVEKNYTEAFKWAQKAERSGSAVGANNLGYCYEFGVGTEPNESNAYYYYKKSALAEDDTGCYNYAMCCFNGYGRKRNLSQAMYWLKKAEKLGAQKAYYSISHLYLLSEEHKDYNAGFEYIKKAEEGEDQRVNYLKGYYHLHGYGCPKDKTLAMQYFKKEIELAEKSTSEFETYNVELATKNLTEYYCDQWQKDPENLGSPNFTIAKDFAEQGLEKGISEGAYELGTSILSYCKEHKITDSIYTESGLFYLFKATELGDANAPFQVGSIYFKGSFSYPKDTLVALQYMAIAAENGNSTAQLNMGYAFLYGENVNRDLLKAMGYFQAAANGGDRYAMYQFGKFLFTVSDPI